MRFANLSLTGFALLTLVACHPASAQLSFTYTSFDPPGAVQSIAYGISNTGDIVGGYLDSLNNSPGYILHNGVSTPVNFPNGVGSETFLYSINSAGVATGLSFDASFNETDFIDTSGVFSTPTHLGAPGGTFLNAINDAGQVALAYFDAGNIAHASIYDITTQAFTDLPDNGAFGTFAQDVAANGDVVVNYVDAANHTNGAIYHNGMYTTLDFPGATDTYTDGINAGGLVVGNYDVNNISHGFVYDAGMFYSLDFPGASTTVVFSGINNANQIVGSYVDANDLAHSMIVTVVPEPSSLALLLVSGLGGAGLLLKRRLRK